MLIDAATLLANDYDLEGDPFSVTWVGDAIGGTVVLLENGTILYTPNSEYYGEGSFRYRTSDGMATAEATASFEVRPVNDAPVPDVPLADVHVTEDGDFYFEVPADAFSDDNGYVTLSATRHGGIPLPEWLSFDGTQGPPPAPGRYNGSILSRVYAPTGNIRAQTSTLVFDRSNNGPTSPETFGTLTVWDHAFDNPLNLDVLSPTARATA